MLENPDWTFSLQACRRAEIFAVWGGVRVEYGVFLQRRYGQLDMHHLIHTMYI